jgi:hypothetical protein
MPIVAGSAGSTAGRCRADRLTIVVDNGGRPTHVVDVGRCRQRLTELRARREDVETTGAFAATAGVSEPSASRFFAGGHRQRIATVRRILRALGLRFEDVAQPVGLVDTPGNR